MATPEPPELGERLDVWFDDHPFMSVMISTGLVFVFGFGLFVGAAKALGVW